MSKTEKQDSVFSHEEIAIIGMAGRFPGARNVDDFWHNLKNGVESVKPIPLEELQTAGVDEKTVRDPYFVNAAAIMPDADAFDASFFGVTVREAEIMDPQHRVFLETAWEALENAGYDPEKFRGLIGIFGGVAPNTYFQNNLATRPELLRMLGRYAVMLGSEREYAITRVSFKLNLTGPSMSVNTACSTSGVAIHLACQSLLGGECDIALAGGARIMVPFNTGYLYEESGIQSPDGHCRAFDVEARGTVVGNGVGILVLKRLSEAIQDGDCIHAVIKGSAINNDGSQKVGFTAPSVQGQASVIMDALRVADVNPDSISYVEAHGTGTWLGDPIEVAALTKAFRNWTARKSYCPIGSVKTNIGHLDAGAGVAGVIKTVLALKHGQIPPSLNFSRPNPQIDFEASPFYVNSTLTDWQAGTAPRRAGVSSFGLGGTNAHIILEQAPEIEPSGSSRPQKLLLLSAKSDLALTHATKNLAEHLRQHPDSNLADVAYTLRIGRQAFNHRRFVVCQDPADAIVILESGDPTRIVTLVQEPVDRNIVLMFSGQGSQYVNMGLGLYANEPGFRQQVDHCSEILKPYLSLDLRQILYPDEQNSAGAAQTLQQTAFTQPALFVIEYALATLWSSWGIHPRAMIGHSIGEYAAACLSGVFSLEDALFLVSARGKHMQQMPSGSMLAVPLSEKSLHPYLTEATDIASVNSPSLCVISGEHDAIKDLEKQLASNGIESTYLHTSHAFHSRMMEPVLERYTNVVRQVKLNAPQIPFVSNVTGTWITAAQATEPSYWAEHLRRPVRFADGIQELVKEPHSVLLEIGPGRTLCTLARQNLDVSQAQVTFASIRQPKENEDDLTFILNSLGRLWAAGVYVDWVGFSANEHLHRIPLPTYPFEHRRYWISPGQQGYAPVPQESASLGSEATSAIGLARTLEGSQIPAGAPRTDVERSLAEIWQGLLGTDQLSIHDNFFDLGGSSLLATRLLTQIAHAFGKRLPLATLFEAPTIAQLAIVLGQPAASVKHSSLIRIKAGQPKSKPPVYCIPGNLGNVFTDLGHLSRHLGLDQPFYGLQDGIGHPWQVEALAAHYVKELSGVQALGPYHIAGICSGGVVAFEMAQQLTHLGHQVGLLALVEPAALPLQGARSYLDLLAEICARLAHNVRHSRHGTEPSRTELVMLVRLRMKLLANLWGLKCYTLQPYPGYLHLFLTNESLTKGSRIGWSKFALGGVQVHEIPGTHRSITGDYEPVADAPMHVLGDQLRACMDHALYALK